MSLDIRYLYDFSRPTMVPRIVTLKCTKQLNADEGRIVPQRSQRAMSLQESTGWLAIAYEEISLIVDSRVID